MLKELSIKNFAIIDELTVEFQDGLTVLTGETGAGKSIIIDAVQLLAGGRGSQEFIRHGTKKAELEGLFALSEEPHPAYEKCAELGIDVEDGIIILRRDISDNGKSVCRVNGKLMPIAMLREVGATLIDIHGQHESQELMDDRHHISLLDQFAVEEIQAHKEEYAEMYETYRQLKNERAALSLNEQQIAQKIDLLSFQINEIDSCKLQPNEEITLAEERLRLHNFHKIFEGGSQAYDAISGESRGLDCIGSAMTNLDDISSVDERFKEYATSITDAFYALQEAAFSVKDMLDELEFDADRLNEVEQRLGVIQNLKRKYGNSVVEILAYREKIGAELETLENSDENIQSNDRKLQALSKELSIKAKTLTKIRKTKALQLSERIMVQLKELYMERAQFLIHIDPIANEGFDQNGQDEVTFYISTNVGEPPKPLTKIASGGEMSRVMIALKTIFSSTMGITSIIFDEVDTGVSGRVAQAIADKISMISMNSQVLCISHLPQVAAMADHHYYIKKMEEHNRTFTSLMELVDDDRIDEISRMMSGQVVTEKTFLHAKELVELANKQKPQNVK